MSARVLLLALLSAMLAGSCAGDGQRSQAAPAGEEPPRASAPKVGGDAIEKSSDAENRRPVEIRPSSEFASMLLETINAERLAAGAEPLAWEPRLVAACQATADRVTEAGADSVDVQARLNAELEKTTYEYFRLQIGFAQMSGRPAEIVAAWRRGAPATFAALEAPDLRDLGLGVGSDDGVPSLVVAAGVTQAESLAEAAQGLDDLEAVRRRVLRRTNRARRDAGLEPFRVHPVLDRIAQDYAADMWRRGFYAHTSPEGEDVGDRAEDERLVVRLVGENIASGQTSADEVMDGWLESPPHRANLLHRRFTHLGVGVAAGLRGEDDYEIRWVQVFAEFR